MGTAKSDIIKELSTSRTERDNAKDVLAQKEDVFEKVRETYRKELDVFKDDLRNCTEALLAECGTKPRTLAVMSGIVIRYLEDGSKYRYVYPFADLSSSGKEFISSIPVATVERSYEELLKEFDATFAKGSAIIKYPRHRGGRNARSWEGELLRSIAFFYYHWELDLIDAINKAKDVIEQNAYLAEDGYYESLTEYLFCLGDAEST